MFDLDTWEEILNTIGKNLMRTFLTGLSVAWGIFMLMILLGVGEGLENGYRKGFADEASNSIFLNAYETSIPYKGLKPGRQIQFTNNDHAALENYIPEIEYISSEVRVGGWKGGVVKYNKKQGSYRLKGIHPQHKEIEFRTVIDGRFINNSDIEGLRKIAVIGSSSKDELFGNSSPIGKYIFINEIPFLVAGVFEEDLGQNQRGNIYLPISTAQKVYGRGNEIDEILFTLKDVNAEQSVDLVSKLRGKIAFTHKFHPDDPRALYVENNFESLKTFTDIFGGINTFIWMVGIGTIIAGIVGVGNIMTVVIKERTKEIGIRKALGATPSNIIAQILKESILITGLFGIFGLMGGIFLMEFIGSLMQEENEMFYNPGVDFSVAIISTLIIILSGTFSGLIPAIRAASIKPIEALRDE